MTAFSHINKNVKLSDVPIGTSAKLPSLVNLPALQARLNQYGLYQGDLIRVARSAPLKGPILVQVNGREVALGREIAEKILVELE